MLEERRDEQNRKTGGDAMITGDGMMTGSFSGTVGDMSPEFAADFIAGGAKIPRKLLNHWLAAGIVREGQVKPSQIEEEAEVKEPAIG